MRFSTRFSSWLLRCGCLSILWLWVLPVSAQMLASAATQQRANTTSPTTQPTLLRDALLTLMNERKVEILFDERILSGKRVGPVGQFNNRPFGTVLTRILTGTGLTYRQLRRNTFVIVEQPTSQPNVRTVGAVQADSEPETSLNQPATEPATQLKPAVATVAERPAPADRTIAGRVLSETGEGLPGVSVVLKNTKKGTTTDADGAFRLSVPDGLGVSLVFSFVGYISQEIDLGNRNSLNVTLLEDTRALNEVVVVGYGQVKKTDLTGSVSTVPVGEIRKLAVTSLDQSLQGRAAGVQITQNSGSPGSATTIRIRGGNSIQGDNEPLYVIDGIPFKNDGAGSGSSFNVLSTLNPSDIESISILKDASSTAIYGSRGANGVVIVTTKRGKAGKSTVNFDAYYGIQNVRRKYPVLNGSEYAQLVNDANTNEGRPALYTPEQVNAFGKGTDWQDEIFQQAPIRNYQLSMSGGDERTQYALSGGYFKQDGLVRNSNFDRYSFRINLDRKLTSRIKIGNSLTVNRTVLNQTRSDGDLGSAGLVTVAALQYPPIIPVYNPDGTFFTNGSQLNFTADNPAALASDSKNRNTAYRIFGNIFGDYQIIDGLNLRVLLGIDGVLQKQDNYLPRTVVSGQALGGSASIFNSQAITWLNENLLTYTRTIGTKHTIGGLFGFTQQANRTEFSTAAARNFVNDNLGSGNLGSGSVPLIPGSGVGTWGLQSYLARVNYGYQDKYLLTASFRSDGSSRFGANKRYGFFPSAALAWRISEEAFLKNSRVVSDLKLRATYGLTGNQDGIGNYPAYSLLSSQNYVFGNLVSTGIGPSQIANPDLSWETTAQTDFGLDVGLFNNRITLTTDVYLKQTRDLLLAVTIPSTSGYSSAIKNLGRVENRGVELSISSRNIDKAFKWSTDFNLSANRNKVLDLGGSNQIFAGQVANIGQNITSGIIRVGEPLGSFFGYVTDGLYQTTDELTAVADPQARKPGDRRYADLNGDKKIDDNDRTIIGRTQPKLIGGLNNTFSYKGVELTVFFQGVSGNQILNANRFELEYLNGLSNQDRDVLNRWTPTNTSTDIPRASTTRPANRISTRQIEDGSYLRLKNIQLAYNLPQSVLKTLKIQSFRVYASAQNYLTFTKYSGYDPEVNRFGQDSRSQGFDYGSYPTAKTILFGLNVGF
nr:SusC/RagA family TonB-linked outer membrane protein [Spirosoma spitsbergense]